MGAPAYNAYSTAPDYYAPQKRRETYTRRNPRSANNKTNRKTHTRNANVRVVRGSRASSTAPQAMQLPMNIVAIAGVMAVVLVMFALLSFARVAISSATIDTSIQTQQIEKSLEEAKSAGNQLEVDACVVSNASSVKVRAKALGMSAPDGVEVIMLPQDVVAQDKSGNLLLGESIRRAGEGDATAVSSATSSTSTATSSAATTTSSVANSTTSSTASSSMSTTSSSTTQSTSASNS